MAHDPDAGPGPDSRPAITLAAFYLACSWTWVLGMYFPVLMIGDFGIPGWIAFAIPNCLGAMSVGFILRGPDHAREFHARHRHAVHAFSLITLAFHAFFIAHLPHLLLTTPSTIHRAAFAIVAGAMLTSALRPRTHAQVLLAAPVTFTLSLLVMAAAEAMSPGQSLALPANRGLDTLPQLAAAVPPLFLGFLLCPYLDTTFLRIRQRTTATGGRRAFALGFLLLFPILITCTLLYADALQRLRALPLILAVHFYIQAQFTTTAHLQATSHPRARHAILAASALAILLGAFLPHAHFRVTYELFMSAYALPLPVYLLYFALPRMQPIRTRTRIIAATLTIAAAAPCFAMGYLAREWFWLFPGIAIAVGPPLLIALLTPRRTPPSTPL